MRVRFLAALVATGLVVSCAENSPEDREQALADRDRTVSIIDGSGAVIGSVDVTEDANGTTLKIDVSGLETGLAGVHLHEVGSCDSPDFTSAGGHWNPAGAEHGRDNPAGAHLGDLANMGVNEGGDGRTTYLLAGVLREGTKFQIADEDGTALVIHAGPDDYRTDPSGESGARVACAVLAEPR